MMLDAAERVLALLQKFLEYPLVATGDRLITPVIGLWALLILLSLHWVAGRLERGIRRVLTNKGRDEKTIYAIVRLSRIGVWLVGLVMLLDTLGVEITGLMAVLAALGVGLGFGLQNLFNNAFSGLILLIEHPVRVGDLIELENRLVFVQEIGWRATRLKTFDNVDLLVPNSRLMEQMLINWTLSEPLTRLIVDFSVSYRCDPRKAREIAARVARTHPAVQPDPPPDVFFLDYGESGLMLSLRFWVREPWNRLGICSDIRFALLEALHAEGLVIPFPHREVYVHRASAAAEE